MHIALQVWKSTL